MSMKGANLIGDQLCEFSLWAPAARQVSLVLRGDGVEQTFAMAAGPDGIRRLETRAASGDRYAYLLDGAGPFPDPVSRHLPEGVHGFTEIIDPQLFTWGDSEWKGLSLAEYVLY